MYVLVPKAEVSEAMINLSTSQAHTLRVTSKGEAVLETHQPDHPVFLPYPAYTRLRVQALLDGQETSWWTWLWG
jgi:hypothetical protein